MSAKSKLASAIWRSRWSRVAVGVWVSRTTAVAWSTTALTIAVGSAPMTAAEAVAWARAGPGITVTAQSVPARKAAAMSAVLKIELDLTAVSQSGLVARRCRPVTCELNTSYKSFMTFYYRLSRRALKQLQQFQWPHAPSVRIRYAIS